MSCSGVRKRGPGVRLTDVAAILRGNVLHGFQVALADWRLMLQVGPAAVVAWGEGVAGSG